MARRPRDTPARSEAASTTASAAAPAEDDVEGELRELTRLVLEAQSVQARLNEHGHRLRAKGVTYRRLAESAGISLQAAYQRWSTDESRRGREAQERRAARLRRGP